MATAPQIDTSHLLAILGVVAAVWALISPDSRLRFRYCVNWLDWIVAGAVLLLIHYLVFAPVLESVGLYYSLGTWKWGLDSASAVYLLLLVVIAYFFWRTRSPALSPSKMRLFRELTENLLLTKRYDELVLLVAPQLQTLIGLSRHQPLLARLTDRFSPRQGLDVAAILSGEKPSQQPAWKNRLRTMLQSIKAWSVGRNRTSAQASELIREMIETPPFVAHLAAVHPYFGLRLVETEEAILTSSPD